MISHSVSNTLLHIDDTRCRSCKRCLAQQICKVKAIVRVDREEPPFVDTHRCHGCMVCVLECPFEAVVAG